MIYIKKQETAAPVKNLARRQAAREVAEIEMLCAALRGVIGASWVRREKKTLMKERKQNEQC